MPYYDKDGLSPLMWSSVLYIVFVQLGVLPDLGRSRATPLLIAVLLGLLLLITLQAPLFAALGRSPTFALGAAFGVGG
jgi:hypothetical protein